VLAAVLALIAASAAVNASMNAEDGIETVLGALAAVLRDLVAVLGDSDDVV
jgi:hypothetical protein